MVWKVEEPEDMVSVVVEVDVGVNWMESAFTLGDHVLSMVRTIAGRSGPYSRSRCDSASTSAGARSIARVGALR